ncbi:hypothetical protein PCL1606_33750 [Pseudomonas chlororaphis]|uniref:Uncharacterized protein n=1 Tax=Pseudomonas chlororaphis TaxID=587753 RepID=A0A0D5Y1A3_9PSED|nr:hypothetical protein PCL1606_33750 [Pseudomonas chlororaphis]
MTFSDRCACGKAQGQTDEGQEEGTHQVRDPIQTAWAFSAPYSNSLYRQEKGRPVAAVDRNPVAAAEPQARLRSGAAPQGGVMGIRRCLAWRPLCGRSQPRWRSTAATGIDGNSVAAAEPKARLRSGRSPARRADE